MLANCRLSVHNCYECYKSASDPPHRPTSPRCRRMDATIAALDEGYTAYILFQLWRNPRKLNRCRSVIGAKETPMTLTVSRLAALVLAFAIASLPVVAQTHTQAQRIYSQAELDQMLAPVALYPDPLLSQVLMAATYPFEVAEAARWSRANPGLQGDDAVRAAQSEDWDPSVQSLVAFPQILARMDENPDWTRRLGEAFLAQEPHVMDTVQQLRRRAQEAGNLQSSEQMYVEQQGQAIVIQPISPQYVYVPYYDPLVVYGSWWWPAYQPVVWAPWPGYARYYRPGVSVGYWWGRPVGLSVGFFFGNFDWHHRQARVVHPTAYYYRPPVAANRTAVLRPHRWQHEPRRRGAFAERRPVPVRQQIPMQSQFPRQERNVAISPERRERRVEQQQERPQPRSQANALPSIQVRPAAPAQPAAQVQPRREDGGDRARIQRREQRNESFPMQRRQEFRPDQRPQPPQIRQEQRARTPEAIAAQPLRTQPEVRPQPQARPQPPVQREQRPRMREAQAPQQSRPERNERGHKGSERP